MIHIIRGAFHRGGIPYDRLQNIRLFCVVVNKIQTYSVCVCIYIYVEICYEFFMYINKV